MGYERALSFFVRGDGTVCIRLTRRECTKLGTWLCVLLFVSGVQVNASRIGRQGMELTWNDGPYQMWGIDISAAARSDESMEQAVRALNTYAKYGVSTVAISFQPAGCGSGVFNRDGAIGNPALREEVQRIVDEVNRHFARYETIKRFALLPRLLDVEKGELTPTLKIRRRIVEDRFKDLLNSLYDD